MLLRRLEHSLRNLFNYFFRTLLGAAQIARQNTLFTYPLLAGAGVTWSRARADYHSTQIRFSHAMTHGLQFDANYTWSKEIDNTDTVEDNQGFNSGGNGAIPNTAGNYDLINLANNRHLGFSDVPHRFVATALYNLPFGKGKDVDPWDRLCNGLVGRWEMGRCGARATGHAVQCPRRQLECGLRPS